MGLFFLNTLFLSVFFLIIFYWSIVALQCCVNFYHMCAESLQTLFDPIYHSPPGSSIHGILEARTLG